MTSVPPQEVPAPPNGNEYRGTLIVAFTWWTVVISVIVVALRFATRKWVLHAKLWWDDWFILAAMTANFMGAILDSLEVHFGFGRHEHYISPNSLRYFTAITYGEWIQTFFTLMCTKVSICYFLLRLQKLSISKQLIRPIQAAIVVLIVSNIVLTLMWILQCIPAWATWDIGVKGKCLDKQILMNVILAQAVISVISDFALALYPILILWKVRLNFRDKAGLCLLMGLGVLTGACCIVRTVLNKDALAEDTTYGGITNWAWRLFEVELGIICACIPTLIPLRKWLRQRKYGRHNSSVSTLADVIAQNPPKVVGADDFGLSSDPASQTSWASPNEVNEKALMGRAGSDFDKDIESSGGPSSSSGTLSSRGGDRTKRSSVGNTGFVRVRDPTAPATRTGNAGVPISNPSQAGPLRTFFSDASADNLSRIPPPIPEQPPPAAVGGSRKVVSFSRRDILHRPDGHMVASAVPQVMVTSPTPGNSVRRPQYQIHAPLEAPRPAPGPPVPTVQVTGDPRQELDIDLSPNFDRNRSQWRKILDINRLSWKSVVSNKSTEAP